MKRFLATLLCLLVCVQAFGVGSISSNAEKAKEVCDAYLKGIKENNVFSEEEYLSVEKEFKEQIYIL